MKILPGIVILSRLTLIETLLAYVPQNKGLVETTQHEPYSFYIRRSSFTMLLTSATELHARSVHETDFQNKGIGLGRRPGNPQQHGIPTVDTSSPQAALDVWNLCQAIRTQKNKLN